MNAVHVRLASHLLAGAIVLALVHAGPLGNAWAGDVHYVYDARGRLSAVTAEDGVTFAYHYDAADNLLSIAPTGLLISEVVPSTGEAGAPVTLGGIGFDAGTSQVRFNGTMAAVTSVTATEIQTEVPDGASSGLITVQNDLGTTTSLIEFLIAGDPPTITLVDPGKGQAGASVQLDGLGFSTEAGQNVVTMNGIPAAVTPSTATELSFIVPEAVASGRIILSTPVDSAEQMPDFLVAPPGYLAAELIEPGVRLAALGGSASVPLNEANKIGLLLFDAAASQRLSFDFGGNVGFCTKEILVRPDSSLFPDFDSEHCEPGFRDPVLLDQTGTWSLALDPNGATTGTRSVTVYVVPDNPRAVLQFRETGDMGTLTTTVPGQDAVFTFEAPAGERLSFLAEVPGPDTPPCLIWHLQRPDSTYFLPPVCAETLSTFFGPKILDVSGIWTLRADDSSSSALHTYKLTIYKVPPDPTVPMSFVSGAGDTDTLTTTVPGQAARFTFTASAGDRLSLIASVTDHDPFSLRILRPDGTVFHSDIDIPDDTFIEPTQLLDASGTWTVVLYELANSELHTYQLKLYKVPADATTTVPTNNTQVTLRTATPGQNARFTFNVGLGASTVDFNGEYLKTQDCLTADSATTCRIWHVLRPSGSQAAEYRCVGQSFSPSPISAGGFGGLGTWTIIGDEAGRENHCYGLSVTVQ